MDFDKILTVIIGIAIIGYLVFMSLPDMVGYYNDAKGVVQNYNTIGNNELLNDYLDSKPNYYFKYEGATYCISVQSLVNEGIIKGDNIDTTEIIEAIYSNDKYTFKYNKDCVEK